jgi:hypothetical protein
MVLQAKLLASQASPAFLHNPEMQTLAMAYFRPVAAGPASCATFQEGCVQIICYLKKLIFPGQRRVGFGPPSKTMLSQSSWGLASKTSARLIADPGAKGF